MAGDWIKVENVTPDKPEVFQMAEALDLDADTVLGKIIRLWIWADQQTYGGNAGSVTLALADCVTGVTGFGKAMLTVGWLRQESHGLVFPNFARHNGQTGKTRGLNALRAARHRAKNSNAAGVTSALPEKSKSKSKETKAKKPQAVFVKPTLEEVQAYCRERSNGIDPEAFMDHHDRNGWKVGKAGHAMKDWRATVRTWERNRKQEQSDGNDDPGQPKLFPGQ